MFQLCEKNENIEKHTYYTLFIHSQMDWGLQQLIHNQQVTSLLGATYKYQLIT